MVCEQNGGTLAAVASTTIGTPLRCAVRANARAPGSQNILAAVSHYSVT